MAKMICLDEQLHTILEKISKATGVPKQDLINQAINGLMKDYLFNKVDTIYTCLHSDDESRKQELEERQAWDATIRHGLVLKDDEQDN